MRGRDIKRYKYDFADLYLIYVPWHFPLHKDSKIVGASLEAEKAFENQYNAIYRYLLQYKTELSDRNQAETGIRYEWYALQRWGANYSDDFNRQKIVWGELSDTPKFALEKTGTYVSEASTFLMTGESLFFLTGFLNSKLSKYCFSKIGTTTGVGTTQWKKFTIEQLPIPKFSPEQQSKYEKLVEKIFCLQNQNTSINSMIEELDRMLYDDFEFLPEEIEVIENQ